MCWLHLLCQQGKAGVVERKKRAVDARADVSDGLGGTIVLFDAVRAAASGTDTPGKVGFFPADEQLERMGMLFIPVNGNAFRKSGEDGF